MLPDNVLGFIASVSIQKGYNNNSFNFNSYGYQISTKSKDGHCNVIEIIKNGQKTYMFCQEGTQNENDFFTDLNAANNSEKKKVKHYKGKVSKSMWNEFIKYRNRYQNFYNTYKDHGELVVSGHSLGGAVAGIAAGIFNLKAILFAPIPFMAHNNWRKNYSIIPKTYVNKTDPCCGDNGQIGQIEWKAGNHIGKNWIYNGYGMDSHKISSFVNYFRDRTNISL